VIRIERGPCPPAMKVYTRKTVKAFDGRKVTKAEQEMEKAVAFFTNSQHFNNEQKLTTETFDFAVYKDPEVREQLGAIFGTKCVYCETDFGAVTPKDIEHFRPKSEITTANGTLVPGYFWLAGEWDNLLVSCPDCNRKRVHEMPGEPEKVTLGKQTHFPLADERHRARDRAPLTHEETVRLLLHPCVDHPENHLSFDEKGLIHPRADAGGVESAMGTKSILVYALQRKPLVERRLKVLNEFRLLFNQLNFLLKNHNNLKALGAPASDVADNLAQIGTVKAAMWGMLTPKAEYLAMLRGWIRTVKATNQCERLEQFGIDIGALIPDAR
jgi:uncharacterized protein (TIGR02646 family)